MPYGAFSFVDGHLILCFQLNMPKANITSGHKPAATTADVVPPPPEKTTLQKLKSYSEICDLKPMEKISLGEEIVTMGKLALRVDYDEKVTELRNMELLLGIAIPEPKRQRSSMVPGVVKKGKTAGAIIDYLSKKGSPASVAELAEKLDASALGIRNNLKTLIESKQVREDHREGRTIFYALSQPQS
jgi:hypothetical protein